MRLSEDFMQELRLRCDIESVISPYVNLKRRGSTLVGLCPFHNEKTGSFTVYPQTNSFYCFGCGVGGDAVTFTQKIENLDYIEAVKMLADKCSLQMPDSGYDDSMQKLRVKILQANREAAHFFHQSLLAPEGKEALNYLLSRQLTPKTTKHFGLGFAPDSWTNLYDTLRAKGFTDDVLLQANLVSRSSKSGRLFDRFRKRVMFPIIDLRGNVIGFGGRRLKDEDSPAKYINTSDTPVYKKTQVLFALNYAKDSKLKGLILSEGYMDVIAMHQAGFDNAVAACGTSFTLEQAKLMSRYTDEIIVTLDADSAGEKGTQRAIDLLQSTGANIKVLRIPDGKDPDEFIRKNGPESFKALIEGAANEIEYRLITAQNKYDLSTDNGVLQYLKVAAKILSEVPDSIARDLYAGRLSEKFNVPVDTIRRQINYNARSKRMVQEKKDKEKITSNTFSNDRINPDKRKYPRASSAEEIIISILMHSPALYKDINNKIVPDDFMTNFNRKIFERTVEILESGRQPELAFYSGDFSAEEMGRIVEIQNKIISGGVAKKQLLDCIEVLKSEKSKASSVKPSDMDPNEWTDYINKISAQKKGNK